MVARFEAERFVSFDHGPEASISEDNFFAMKAFENGYTFDFIEGEMREKSPFTIKDLLEQRKRFVRGNLLVVHSPKIPVKNKLLLGTFVYSMMVFPFCIIDLISLIMFPLLNHRLLVLNTLVAFVRAVPLYMLFLGLAKSWSLMELDKWQFFFGFVGTVCLLPFQYTVMTITLFRALIEREYNFYIVQK